MSLYKDAERVLITKDRIEQRVEAVAQQISRDYQHKNPVFICVLKGAVVFFSDLIKRLDIRMEAEFMTASSYRGTQSTGKVDITKALDCDIKGRHIVIVEDIIDSGLTVKRIMQELEDKGAASIKLCVLLDKPECRKTQVKADYVGFEIPNVFVIGYGLDYEQQYRNMADICVLKPSVYSPES